MLFSFVFVPNDLLFQEREDISSFHEQLCYSDEVRTNAHACILDEKRVVDVSFDT